jgi:hypothetical protein
MTSEEQEAKWEAHKKLCAARMVWKKRGQKIPNQNITWEKWWEKMFQDDYREYTDKQMAKKKGA